MPSDLYGPDPEPPEREDYWAGEISVTRELVAAHLRQRAERAERRGDRAEAASCRERAEIVLNRRKRRQAVDMTIEDKIKEKLVANGMFPGQANEVMELVKADRANEPMSGRWLHDVEGYTPALLIIVWLCARLTALEYIKEKYPKAWFRPMFETAEPKATSI